MDDKGYVFTPIAFLITIPVIILAVSYGGIIDEINAISAIAIGGDVTANVANGVVTAIKQDTEDAGRNAAFQAVQNVINRYNLLPGNNPFFSKNTSKSFIINNTATMLNINITNTSRELERQTGRDIYINGIYINPSGNNNTITLFRPSDLSISQSDPWGFNITVPSLNVTVVQNSNQSYQNVTFKTPPQNVYISIEKIEDPYIWVNTKARQSNIIWRYPYYTDGNYHFADNVSAAKLSYLYECLVGANVTMGYRPYYFPDTHGLTFFDRLENRTVSDSIGPNEAKLSTFILNDPLINEHRNNPTSILDHEYFTGKSGIQLTTKKGSATDIVLDPTGRPFLISTDYLGYLFNTTISQFTY